MQTNNNLLLNCAPCLTVHGYIHKGWQKDAKAASFLTELNDHFVQNWWQEGGDLLKWDKAPEVLAKQMEFVFVWNFQDEVSLSEEQRLICQFASTYNRNTIKVEKSELKPSCKKALIISSSYLWYE